MTQQYQPRHARNRGGERAPQGQTIGRYRLGRILGTGGFATVYLAEDSALRRQVAIKLLHADLAGDQYTVQRFEAEARAAANLRHPNIVGVYDVGQTDDGRSYLVMEFLPGSPLSQVLAETGAFSAGFVAPIINQLASALDSMHGQGIIHRDVKPSNVMLAESGHVTLMDFGSVRELMPEARRTLTGELLGTLDYMAPEQITGGAITPATDVYALGLLAFELLTGVPPFTGPAARVMHDQVYTPAPSVRQRKPGVPATMERAIASALAKDPRDRPKSATAFAYRFTATGPEETDPRRQAAVNGHRLADLHTRPGAAPRSIALGVLGVVGLLLGIFLLALLSISQLFGRGLAPAATGSRVSTTVASVRAAPTASPRPGLAQAVSTASPSATAIPSPAQATAAARGTPAQAAAPPVAADRPVASCAMVEGQWQFTDVIRYGNGVGQQYSFNVRLQQQGSHVTGSGTLSLSGQMDGCVLRATFGQSSAAGEFIWSFSPDGTQFSGTFSAPSFGNGGDSIGKRLSGPSVSVERVNRSSPPGHRRMNAR